MNVGRQVMPRRYFTKLAYDSGNIGYTVSTGLGNHGFRINSLFDPDFSGVGHQPRGFDQLAGLYYNYIVHGCKITVYAQNLSAGQQGVMALTQKTVSSTPTNIREVLESGDTIKKATFTTDRPLVMSRYISLPRLFGVSKDKYRSEGGFGAGVGASPEGQAYCYVSWQNLNETTSTGFNIRAQLKFLCEFFDPRILPTS